MIISVLRLYLLRRVAIKPYEILESVHKIKGVEAMGGVFLGCPAERAVFLHRLVKRRLPHIEEEIYRCQKKEVSRVVFEVFQIKGVIGSVKLHPLNVRSLICLVARERTYECMDKIMSLYVQFFSLRLMPSAGLSFALPDFSSRDGIEGPSEKMTYLPSFEAMTLHWWEMSVIEPEIQIMLNNLALRTDPRKEFLFHQEIRRYLFP